MPDIFSDMLEVGKKKADVEKDPLKEKPSNSSGKTEKSKSSCASSSKSESSSSKKKDSGNPVIHAGQNQDALSSLANIMQTGFQNLERILLSCSEMSDEPELPENLEMECETNIPSVESDVFETLSSELDSNSKLGPEISPSLAKLADKILITKMLSTDEKIDKYRRPANVEFLAVPHINKPIWGNMSHDARLRDSGLQCIQREFLSSAIPVLKVMSQLNEAKDDLNMLDAAELIRTLRDGLSFLGSANFNMVQKRRSLIKDELPSNMHLLCQDSANFSGTNLFGDSLSSDIKEVTELNKISSQLRGRGFTRRGRGRFPLRGGRGYPFKRRGFLGRFIKKSSRGTFKSKASTPLNRNRLSKM